MSSSLSRRNESGTPGPGGGGDGVDHDDGETELLRLCQAHAWALAIDRAASHPEEATASATTTILSPLLTALRSGAPLELIRSLVRAAPDQLLRSRHPRSGTTIHAAISRLADIDVVRYLVGRVAEHEAETKAGTGTLFSYADDRGETCLHCLCERAARDARGCRDEREWNTAAETIRIVAEAYPPAIRLPNLDGLSALALVLSVDSAAEAEGRLLELVGVLLGACPEAAALTPPDHATVGTRCPSMISPSTPMRLGREGRRVAACGERRHHMSLTRPTPNPLSFALLHGHSAGVVRLLLTSCSEAAARDMVCSIVTSEEESPLHLALNMRADAEVLKLLLRYGGSETANRKDYADMTPLCWAWTRHVVDRPFRESSRDGTLHPIKTSRRRYLPTNYSQLLDEAAREIEAATATSSASLRRGGDEASQAPGLAALWEKVEALLPHAAAAQYRHEHRTSTSSGDDRRSPTADSLGDNRGVSANGPDTWSPVHAAAYLPCPRRLLCLASHHHPSQLRLRDTRGNLPLHYAAARPGYALSATPVGYHRAPERIAEASAAYDVLPLCPEAATAYDARRRVALHLALDALEPCELCRRSSETGLRNFDGGVPPERNFLARPFTFGDGDRNGACRNDGSAHVSNAVAIFIIGHNAGALERRDGGTRLYPFMQAAAKGCGGECVEAAYVLLRRLPTLVALGIPGADKNGLLLRPGWLVEESRVSPRRKGVESGKGA